MVPIKRGAAKVELCARHRKVFREESHQTNMATLFDIEKRKTRRYFLAQHIAQGGDLEPKAYQEIVREVIADFPDLFSAPSTPEKS